MELYAVILAGGSGTRLWPMSTKDRPKQLLSFDDPLSLLQKTAVRLLKILPAERLFVVTSASQASEVSLQLRKIAPATERNVLVEPEPKNTLPAVLWAVSRIADSNDQAVVGVFPSDHLISGEEAFLNDVGKAATLAQKGHLMTFGLKPDAPSTGFGYLKAGKPLENGARLVERFLEKPDRKTAERLLSEGLNFWNSGMFVFKASTFLDEVKRLQPEISRACETLKSDRAGPLLQRTYGALPSLSIDHGIMEKSGKVAMVPASFGWSDLGSWESVYEFLPKDENGNVLRGNVRALDTHNSLLISSHGIIAAIGLEDLVVIRSNDSLLVCPRRRSEEVKRVAEPANASLVGQTTERPWGRYTVLEEAAGYKLKRIVVDPGQKLSLQRHSKRAEHWVVIEGTAKVLKAGEEITLGKNESTYIAIGQLHRLENPGSSPLVIIEVQTGDYVGEDDIERFDDIYGREIKTSAF